MNVTFKDESVYDGVNYYHSDYDEYLQPLDSFFFLFREKLDLSMRCDVYCVRCKSRTWVLTDRSC